MSTIGAFYELEVACRGKPSEQSGYLLNIAQIDRVVREQAVPVVEAAFGEPGHAMVDVLAAIFERIGRALPVELRTVCWRLSPYHCLEMTADDEDRYLLSQMFEFAAAHRLHSEALSEAENRAVHGKCNNPSGHGHNYRLRASVALERCEKGPVFDLSSLEEIVDRVILRRFDHKHLNLDTVEFAERTPSVEHIAMVCHDLLQGPVREAGGELHQVTVWETDKTSCTYPVH